MLRNVRDARAFIGMMIYVVSLASLFKIVREGEGDTLYSALPPASPEMKKPLKPGSARD
jgi:hypothetical protein